jgi:1-aminocyclopropane-1-carboxylate deaminase/D-cysteine desulfhydrase-like pyridoxal-dependent ACC family enzyme
LVNDIGEISIDNITDADCRGRSVSLEVLRLDRIHPVVSGNKLFKLRPFMERAIEAGAGGLLTFGGAYSNHLVATAFLCKDHGKKSVGIVRGERPATLSPTLIRCLEFGMELRFLGRREFAEPDSGSRSTLLKEYPSFHMIPEGGYDPLGAAGAAAIAEHIPEPITHIACATGTCTMLTGLYKTLKPQQILVALPAIRGATDILQRMERLLGEMPDAHRIHVEHRYHFGGYGKHDAALIRFMNELHAEHNIPTDKVYTAKLFFGLRDMIARHFFPPGSRILAIHSGGLQGNASLPAGALSF